MPASPSHEDLLHQVCRLKEENERLRREIESLKQSRQTYQMLVENVPDMIWIMSADRFELKYLSPAAKLLTGYTAEEALEKSFQDILSPASYAKAAAYFAEEIEKLKTDKTLMTKTHTLEIEYIQKDGSSKWVSITARPVFDKNNNLTEIIGVSRDISKQVEAQKALEKSEERYRTLFETSRDTIYITTREGRFVEINPAGLELFGYTKEEIFKLDLKQLYFNPEDREKFQKAIEREGYVRDYAVKFKKKDNTPLDCLITSTLRRSEDGAILGYQGIIRDISAQKRMMAQLYQAQKMEAIGTLAGGIAHNFNNLLMTIQGNTSLMLMKTGPDDPNFQRLKTIEKQIQYGSDLSKQLLGFARRGQYQVKTINLNAQIQASATMFAAAKKEITIQTRFFDGLWAVEADPGQMDQVMLNLYVNAWQAMPGGGTIYIQTQNITLGKYQLASFQYRPGDYVKISVTDTGVGMDETVKQKIFEPFFTTKEPGQGTGLGLSSVYGIVKNHGGYITVYSEPGKGATFNIYLPATHKSVEDQEKTENLLFMGRETVLLVDDEPIIIETAQIMLSELGYTVLTADNGETGIDLFRRYKGEIDVVILDLIMPKMSGAETFNRIKSIDPAARVLLSSGYSRNGQAEELLQKGCSGFIQKPFNILELSRKVREVLDGSGGGA